MDLQETLTALVERVAKLEAAKPRKRVYNQQNAARELGMSVNKLRREMNTGRIKGTRNGRLWFITDEEIQRYIAEGDAS
jgi:hypothetical protein